VTHAPVGKPKPDTPYSGDCGYELTGLVDSSKCPECGRPLVEVLIRRPGLIRGTRYAGRTRVFGLPPRAVTARSVSKGRLLTALAHASGYEQKRPPPFFIRTRASAPCPVRRATCNAGSVTV
jgi:hypothetical protein